MKKKAGGNIYDSWVAQAVYETEYGHRFLITASKLSRFFMHKVTFQRAKSWILKFSTHRKFSDPNGSLSVG